jgi:hypothetical protein
MTRPTQWLTRGEIQKTTVGQSCGGCTRPLAFGRAV